MKVKELGPVDIYDLYCRCGILIFHQPELFVHSDTDARIITNMYGDTSVFLNMRTGENPFYECFLLWHEFGHYMLNEMAIQPRSFNLAEQEKLIEVDSNIFAFFGLFSSGNFIKTADGYRYPGMPDDVLDMVITILKEDAEFVAYMNN